MNGSALATDSELRAGVASLGSRQTWDTTGWVPRLAAVITRVREADQRQRAARDFQERLWENTDIAATGLCTISVLPALDDVRFRHWVAEKSMAAVPTGAADRTHFLGALYNDLQGELSPYLNGRMPHLKIFRAMAALYPEALTTMAHMKKLNDLTRVMGGPGGLNAVARHIWVRGRLDTILGESSLQADDLAERIALPWMLFERFVQPSASGSDRT